jgi:hypothetical protein
LKVFQVSGERGWRRRVECGNSSMIYLIHFKNICKCCNVSTPSTTIIIKKRSPIHFELTLHKVREMGSSFNLLQVEIQFSHHHFLKRFYFLQHIFLGSFVENKMAVAVWAWVRDFIKLDWLSCLLLWQYHSGFYYCSYAV